MRGLFEAPESWSVDAVPASVLVWVVEFAKGVGCTDLVGVVGQGVVSQGVIGQGMMWSGWWVRGPCYHELALVQKFKSTVNSRTTWMSPGQRIYEGVVR